MRVSILGTGTSTGVPVPGCRCPVCTSDHEKNKRYRTSAYVEIQQKDTQEHTGDPQTTLGGILIDTSTDLREQALRNGFTRVDAVFYTHAHADHIHGIDDLRGFYFLRKDPIPLFASEETADLLEQKFAYCFATDPDYEGGAPPRLTLTRIKPYVPVPVCGVEVLPLPVHHGSSEIFGFRIGSFAYITDCSGIPERTRECLQGLEVLILDGLRNRPHRTHFTHAQAVKEAEKIRPEKTFLTHITHEIDHDSANEELRKKTDLFVECGYDGLALDL